MFLHRLRDRAKDHPRLGQVRLECRADRFAVKHRVHRDAGQPRPLVQRHAELLVRLEQLGIHLVEALRAVAFFLGRAVVGDVLKINRWIFHVRPGRAFQFFPVPKCLQPPLEQPLRLVLLGGDEPDGILAQARLERLALDVGDEAVLVVACDKFIDGVRVGSHAMVSFRPQSSHLPVQRPCSAMSIFLT